MKTEGMTRRQKLTIINGVGLVIVLIVILQLWLLTATMDAWRGGDKTPVWPAAAASLVCFICNLLLIRRFLRLERSSTLDGTTPHNGGPRP
jgi:hypothetical protein